MIEREEVFVSNGTKLYGTLSIPDRGGRYPAVLFIHGSFPQNRDGDVDSSNTVWFPKPIPGRNLFGDEAVIFQRAGIATFRYDKRGAGKSEGDINDAGLLDIVEDARNALRWLTSIPEVDPARIAILGQSEGSLVSLMLASEIPDIWFLVLQGSFYHSGDQSIKWQADNFKWMPAEAAKGMKSSLPML